jgi:hypothetical protein
VHRAQRREHHERVAVGVTAAEIVEVDLVFTLTERQLVLERAPGQKLGLVALEGVHLLHVGLRIFLHHRFDLRTKELVAAGVVAVRVGVDDRGHRLVGDGPDAIENDLTPARKLGIHHDDAAIGNEHGGIAPAESGTRAPPRDDVKIVPHLLQLGRRDRCRRQSIYRRSLKGRHADRERADREDGTEHQ